MNITLRPFQRVWMILLFLMPTLALQSQDIHFSQFYNSPLQLSPGLAGVHGGDVRIMGTYRNQWQSVPVPYMTFSGAYDTKLKTDARKNGYFSGGVLFNYDRSGLSKLTTTNFAMTGSYTYGISQSLFLTGGAQVGLNQRAFRLEDLTFGSQFDGEIFNPNSSIRENFSSTNVFYADFSGGVNFRVQDARANRWTKRSKLDVGVALYHINNPGIGFYEDENIKLPGRLSLYLGGTLMVSPVFDLVVNGTSQLQGPYNEHVLGAAGKLHLSRKRAREVALQVGANYRLNMFKPESQSLLAPGEAIIPTVEVLWRQWEAGFSYDVNISDFNIATDKKGGPEFNIRYTIYRVKPLDAFKICPII